MMNVLCHLLWCHHLFSLCLSIKSFEAYRVLQYEKNQRPLGSSKSSVDNLISPIYGDHDLGRNVGVIAVQDLTLELLQSLAYRRCQSLLIILPNNNDNSTLSHIYSDSFYVQFQEIEHFLMTNAFDFSIFFGFNDNDILPQLLRTTNHLFKTYGNKNSKYLDIERRYRKKQSLFEPLMSPFSMHDLYELQGSETSNPIHSVKFSNLFARILRPFRDKNVDTDRKYIVISANHDSFGIVPQLSFGVNDNGSGITAIMCLMNLFYKLYDAEESGSDLLQYDLLFLLSAGGYTNYKGTTKWIENNIGGKTFLGDIAMVFCIDSIGSGHNLYLYTTPSFMDPEYSVFRRKAKAQGINLKMKNNTIESDTRLNGWHHEEFARNKLNAITISAKSETYLTWNGTSILDNINRIDLKTLHTNIEYLASVLMALVYNENDEIYKDKARINERYMNNYVNYLNRIARFGPYHHKSSYLKKLKNDFQLNSHETNIMQYPQNEIYEKFYSTDTITIKVFYVKPYIFDLLFMICSLLYLFLVYVVLNQPKTLPQFIDLFK